MESILDFTRNGLERAAAERRLFVTLTYAQSIDGSIAAARGQQTLLSGQASMKMTHSLRTLHEGILVGIGTILADNPSLNARCADGPNPQPLVVDAKLQCPLNIKLFTQDACKKPWILTLDESWDQEKVARKIALEAAGAVILPCSSKQVDGKSSGHIDLSDAFRKAFDRGLGSIMVEGGASILAGCLTTHASTGNLLDHAIVTIAPVFIGGFKGVGTLLPAFPRVERLQACPLENDMVLFGVFSRPDASS
ncbi:unnamed protein product [Aphanomyces euteiches]|uniref:Bacterial bifunctional deaminase-reductase C-terminal domain-containing protein n=1 Tax=Aphanomyces euteiches TaxID=100861 RepID=A0A6G0XHC2_9STRA|nr:hypothetical protein Ae201684_004883 [Aphanomyces euteiches]KAH9157042.1 hypothetical protein AeRB84_001080 [Aphanomyces euteiches]